jgi:hypothetical protein
VEAAAAVVAVAVAAKVAAVEAVAGVEAAAAVVAAKAAAAAMVEAVEVAAMVEAVEVAAAAAVVGAVVTAGAAVEAAAATVVVAMAADTAAERSKPPRNGYAAPAAPWRAIGTKSGIPGRSSFDAAGTTYFRQQKRAAEAALFLYQVPQRLEGAQVLGRGLATTRIGDSFEGDLLAFLKVAKTGALDGGDVDEHVRRAVIRLDEAKTLGGIKPLNSTGSHGSVPLMALPHTTCERHQIHYRERPRPTDGAEERIAQSNTRRK